MAFQKWIRPVGHTSRLDGSVIAINKTSIGFGTYKPSDTGYVTFEYDKDDLAIRFSPGKHGEGYKLNTVKGTVNERFAMNASTFIERKLLPQGVYLKVADNTFQYEKKYSEQHQDIKK